MQSSQPSSHNLTNRVDAKTESDLLSFREVITILEQENTTNSKRSTEILDRYCDNCYKEAENTYGKTEKARLEARIKIIGLQVIIIGKHLSDIKAQDLRGDLLLETHTIKDDYNIERFYDFIDMLSNVGTTH